MKHIILLVDASGSMGTYTQETREAIFNIVKELEKDIHFTLVFFDTYQYNIVIDDQWGIDPYKAYSFKANGGTPITDSIYKAIQDISAAVDDIELLSQEHKIIVFTDGEENSSKFVKSEELGAAIQHMTENFGWDFKFIGPRSCENGIMNYTNSIKIQKKNVSLYSEISDGLKTMKEMVAA